MSTSTPPQPAPDVDSQGFWDALREGHLAMQRCTSCDRFQHPPREVCADCGAAVEYRELKGSGEVFSFIVVRHPTVPGYLEKLPYVVALIELDDQPGLRLPAQLVDIEPADVAIGLHVDARVIDLDGGDYRIPVFSPVS